MPLLMRYRSPSERLPKAKPGDKRPSDAEIIAKLELGYKMQEVGSWAGITASRVQQISSSHGRKYTSPEWTDADIKRLVQLRELGYSTNAISYMMPKFTYGSIETKITSLRKLGR